MSNPSSQLNTVLSAVFFSPKPGTKGPQNGVDLLKRAKFVGQNTKLWRPVVHQHNPAGAVGYHDTAPQSICILAKLGTQPPHGSKLPGRIWQNNGRRMNFLRRTVFFQISVFPGCSCGGGGEMIKRCGGKARESRQWSEHPLLHLVSLSVSNPPTPVTLAIT